MLCIFGKGWRCEMEGWQWVWHLGVGVFPPPLDTRYQSGIFHLLTFNLNLSSKRHPTFPRIARTVGVKFTSLRIRWKKPSVS